jgi:transcription antitermination factor NusG
MAVAYPFDALGSADSNAAELINTSEWFALRVRTRWERTTATLLNGKGYETFLPTYKMRRRWARHFKEVEAPLFPGYVFCSFDVQKRLPILITPGVITVVSRGKIPVPVDQSELDALRAIVRSGIAAQPWPYLEIGQRIRIEDEALQGLEGILISFKGSHRVVLSVSLLCRSVALEIDRSRVRPIRPQRHAGVELVPAGYLVGEPLG